MTNTTSPGEQYASLLESSDASESFVRRSLQQLESDFRETALLALADWAALKIESPEMFHAVASLQRPSWGMWNGLITSLKKARTTLLKTAGDDLRERIEAADVVTTVLKQYELRLDADTAAELKPLAELTRSSLPKKLRLGPVLTMPIALRNRIAHDAPTSADWWKATAAAVRPLIEFHCHLAPLSLILADRDEHPSPWFLTDDAGSVLAFNGLARDQSVIYVSVTGESQYSPERTRETLLTFQSLLGKTDDQEDDFRRLLTRLAPEEIRGVMLGKYIVGRPAGAGGFGTVHVGRQLNSGRRTAIKILHDGQDDRAKERFQQEGRFLAQLDHPNVVGVYGFGEETWSAPRAFSLSDEDWFEAFSKSAPVKCYIAMEWIDGRTLDEFVTLPTEDRPSLRELAGWMSQASSALAAVHNSGLVHRDIKPGNLMVSGEGDIKLMDFGIARSQARERTLQTATGSTLGTPAYMSPEQLRASQREAEVGPATDVYGLCAAFYEVFTGSRLFDHDSATLEMVTTRKLSGEKPTRPRLLTKGLPWELETILLGGLEPDVKDRYASMDALRLDLDRFLDDEPIHYRRPSVPRQLQLWYRRNRMFANQLAVGLIVAVIGIFLYVRDITLALDQRDTADQKRRKAEVNLLRTGDSETARVVLDNIRQYATTGNSNRATPGQSVLDLITRDLGADNIPQREALRLRLALLPDSPDKHRDALLAAARTATPSNVFLIRDRMQPFAGPVIESAWSSFSNSASSSEQLRMACCLAAWAPDDERWPDAAETVADLLVSQRTLEIAGWQHAFQDVSEFLIPPLIREFLNASDDRALERQTAATLLADYLANEPAMLVDLIIESDRNTFPVLLEAVAAVKPDAVPLLNVVLDRTVTRDDLEPPLSEEWPAVGDDVYEKIESLTGLVTDRFAFVCNLNVEEFPDLDKQLQVGGYRVQRYRRFRKKLAVLWNRDAHPTRIETAPNEEELQTLVSQQVEDGFMVIDACCFDVEPESGPLEQQFAAVFRRMDAGAVPSRLSVTRTFEQPPWASAGFAPRVLQFSDRQADKVRLAIWHHAAGDYPPWTNQEIQVGGDNPSVFGEPAHDVSLHVTNSQVQLSGLWIRRRDVEGITYQNIVNESFLGICRDLEQKDWYLVGLDIGVFDNTGRLAATTAWQRKLIPAEVRDRLDQQQAKAALALLRLTEPEPVPEVDQPSTADTASASTTHDGIRERVWFLLQHSDDPGLRSHMVHLFQPLGVPVETLTARLADESDVSIRRALILALGEYPAEALEAASDRQRLLDALKEMYRSDPDSGIHAATHWTLRRWGESVEEIDQELQFVSRAVINDLLARRDAYDDAYEHDAALMAATALATGPAPEPPTAPEPPETKNENENDSATSDTTDNAPDDTREGPDPSVKRNWFVTPAGHTMAVVPGPVRLEMGSPPSAPNWNGSYERTHHRVIPRGFAMSTAEVRLGQFERFIEQTGMRNDIAWGSATGDGIQTKGPVGGIDVFAAAVYCDWLSELENIPPDERCYIVIRNPQTGAPSHVQMAPGYLNRRGYRLPTEAEWEYMCRAGSKTTRFFGHSEKLLARYGWSASESHGVPAATQVLKPNDLGQFDMLGNLAELCEPVYRTRAVRDSPAIFEGFRNTIHSGMAYAQRGGHFSYDPTRLRDTFVDAAEASELKDMVSFRVARTWQSRRGQFESLTQLLKETPSSQALRLARAQSAADLGDFRQAQADYHAATVLAGNGLWLTGKGEHVLGPHLPFDKWPAFTIEAWVQNWQQRILSQGDTGNARDNALSIGAQGMGWRNALDYAGYNYVNQWGLGFNHVAMVYDGGTFQCFLNGTRLTQYAAPPPGPQAADRALMIGTSPTGAFPGSGLIQALRISDVARYTTPQFPTPQVPTPQLPAAALTAEPEPGTQLLYVFANASDQHASEVITDHSGKDRHGRLINAWWLSPK